MSKNYETEIPDNQAESTEPTGENDTTPKQDTRGFMRKHPVITVLLFAVLAVVVVYFWKDIQGNRERQAVIERATLQLQNQNKEMLTLLCKPMVWTIREELLRQNLEQVNLFTNDMVKEKNLESIHLIEPSGNFLVSTNKKLEGQSASGMFDATLLATDSILVVSTADGWLIAASPVMGYDKRMCTLVLQYQPEAFNAENEIINNEDRE
jgi:hypothetical protein